MAGLLTMSLDELMGEARRAAIQAKKKVEAVADKGKQPSSHYLSSSSAADCNRKRSSVLLCTNVQEAASRNST